MTTNAVKVRLGAEAAGLGAKTHGSIKLDESVPYKEGTIRGRGVKGDGLTPHHIPSYAALVEAREESVYAAEAKRLGRRPGCSQPMMFVASVDSGLTPFGPLGFEGILYGFWCDGCAIADTRRQD